MFLAIFIITALLIILGIVLSWKGNDDDALACFGTAFFIGLFGSLIALVIGMFTYIVDEGEDGYEVASDLKALSVDTSVSGSFFLGIGGFGEDAEYYYIEETDRGMQMDSVEVSDRVFLKEVAGAEPQIIRHCGKYDSPGWWWFPFNDPADDEVDCWSYSDITFVVPPGSVTYKFQVKTPGTD